ncbi:MAG: YidC/Oxa1 family membrane protein insertase [Chloroflexota bacterium]|nr:YidC/Oxa1 family membrane protein insertase [Chloroflexota bacterium]
MFKLSRNTIIVIAVAVAIIVVLAVFGPVEVWNNVLLRPMMNFLVLLSYVFFGSFGVAIIVLTIIVRLLTFPLTLRQMKATKSMSTLAPKMQELQKKYAKDQEKLRKEVAALYKEAGVNPIGCTWPMLVQFPIWIALYQSVTRTLATSPEELISLSQNLYSLPIIQQSVPLEASFLWLNLGVPDTYFVLAILCGASMWVLQKMSTVPAADPKQQSMTKTMVWMMPLIFAMFTLMVPSGLGLFWVVSNIIGIIMQYFVTGWGGLFSRAPAAAPAAATEQPKQLETPLGAEQEAQLETERTKQEKRSEHGKSRDKRKDRRGSRRDRSRKARRRS